MNKEDFGRFGGSLTANVIEFHPDAIPMPDTLRISMNRGEHRIADELHKSFGGFERVIIDVDGERHEFDVDSLIRLLESYEGASRWHELFGTPEKVADYFATQCMGGDGYTCEICPFADCDGRLHVASHPTIRNELLEWLRGDA